MGSESSDPIAFQSSIALLQERFRQLQRVKKMREEKELLMRKLPEPKPHDHTTKDYEPMAAGVFFHFLPPKPPSAPLSLWSDSQSRQTSMESKKTPVLMSFLPAKTSSTSKVSSVQLEGCSDCDDVDTSLHL
ncbi:hypothetical protein SLEP1_g29113 [Rubroshorea leprosula]|uniref:Uncharacterized protein n=1 Tax=Rubroshorea leprosula TaxID=152421 RepID=A0AAV5K7L7_9ROSI|nr:hypothetical protein SLEP1_g29113 [Rubroshorea leprosula]